MLIGSQKHIHFNRVKNIISNSDNEIKHMASVKNLVHGFEDLYGISELSTSLWERYNNVYKIVTKNK